MPAFQLMNIEIRNARGDPWALKDTAYEIAHYLLDKGPVIKDGDTISCGPWKASRLNSHPRCSHAMRQCTTFLSGCPSFVAGFKPPNPALQRSGPGIAMAVNNEVKTRLVAWANDSAGAAR